MTEIFFTNDQGGVHAMDCRPASTVAGMATPLLTSPHGAVVTLLDGGGDAALGAAVLVQADLPVATCGPCVAGAQT